MLEKLDFMLRFWDLKARHGAMGAPLTAMDQVELLSLIRMMSTDHPLPEMGPPPRTEQRVPVQLTAPGGFVAGELRMVCAGGIVVAASSLLHAGQSTILRLADAVAAVEYTLPCSVYWTFAGTPGAMALRVDGAPTRTSFALPESDSWRSPLGVGWSDSSRLRVG